jgi:hypothetical protein
MQNPSPKKMMYLTSHRKARKHLARLINEFNQDPKADVTRYRCITFMFKALLDYFQFDKSIEIEDRILEIEKKLDSMGK